MTGRPIGENHPENEARKVHGLPECLQLVFYENPREASSKTDIISWEIAGEREGYDVLSITTDKETRLVHEGIIAFMQHPNFIKENRTTEKS